MPFFAVAIRAANQVASASPVAMAPAVGDIMQRLHEMPLLEMSAMTAGRSSRSPGAAGRYGDGPRSLAVSPRPRIATFATMNHSFENTEETWGFACNVQAGTDLRPEAFARMSPVSKYCRLRMANQPAFVQKTLPPLSCFEAASNPEAHSGALWWFTPVSSSQTRGFSSTIEAFGDVHSARNRPAILRKLRFQCRCISSARRGQSAYARHSSNTTAMRTRVQLRPRPVPRSSNSVTSHAHLE